MTDEFPPLVYVDLIEIEPMTFDQHSDRYRGFADPQARYAAYLDKFQPWRVVVKSGDNQRKMFRSTERYFNRADALHAIELCFANKSNVYLREAEKGIRPLRMAAA